MSTVSSTQDLSNYFTNFTQFAALRRCAAVVLNDSSFKATSKEIEILNAIGEVLSFQDPKKIKLMNPDTYQLIHKLISANYLLAQPSPVTLKSPSQITAPTTRMVLAASKIAQMRPHNLNLTQQRTAPSYEKLQQISNDQPITSQYPKEQTAIPSKIPIFTQSRATAERPPPDQELVQSVHEEGSGIRLSSSFNPSPVLFSYPNLNSKSGAQATLPSAAANQSVLASVPLINDPINPGLGEQGSSKTTSTQLTATDGAPRPAESTLDRSTSSLFPLGSSFSAPVQGSKSGKPVHRTTSIPSHKKKVVEKLQKIDEKPLYTLPHCLLKEEIRKFAHAILLNRYYYKIGFSSVREKILADVLDLYIVRHFQPGQISVAELKFAESHDLDEVQALYDLLTDPRASGGSPRKLQPCPFSQIICKMSLFSVPNMAENFCWKLAEYRCKYAGSYNALSYEEKKCIDVLIHTSLFAYFQRWSFIHSLEIVLKTISISTEAILAVQKEVGDPLVEASILIHPEENNLLKNHTPKETIEMRFERLRNHSCLLYPPKFALLMKFVNKYATEWRNRDSRLVGVLLVVEHGWIQFGCRGGAAGLKAIFDKSISLATLPKICGDERQEENLNALEKILNCIPSKFGINHLYFQESRLFQQLILAVGCRSPDEDPIFRNVQLQLMRLNRWMTQFPGLSLDDALLCGFSSLHLRELFRKSNDEENAKRLIMIIEDILPLSNRSVALIDHCAFRNKSNFVSLYRLADFFPDEKKSKNQSVVLNQLKLVYNQIFCNPNFSMTDILTYGFSPHILRRLFKNGDDGENMNELIAIFRNWFPDSYERVLSHPYFQDIERFDLLKRASQAIEIQDDLRFRAVQVCLYEISTLGGSRAVQDSILLKFSPSELRKLFLCSNDSENVSLLIQIWEKFLPLRERLNSTARKQGVSSSAKDERKQQ